MKSLQPVPKLASVSCPRSPPTDLFSRSPSRTRALGRLLTLTPAHGSSHTHTRRQLMGPTARCPQALRAEGLLGHPSKLAAPLHSQPDVPAQEHSLYLSSASREVGLQGIRGCLGLWSHIPPAGAPLLVKTEPTAETRQGQEDTQGQLGKRLPVDQKLRRTRPQSRPAGRTAPFLTQVRLRSHMSPLAKTQPPSEPQPGCLRHREEPRNWGKGLVGKGAQSFAN